MERRSAARSEAAGALAVEVFMQELSSLEGQGPGDARRGGVAVASTLTQRVYG
ncbi:hypothetical protein D3C71_2226360 [compost metagenome]